MPAKLNLIGQRFGKLVVLKEAEKKNTSIRWHCKCDCGKTSIPSTVNLRNGVSKSCGCVSSQKLSEWNKKKATHNMRSSPVYQMWAIMHKNYSVSDKWAYTEKGGHNFEQWVMQQKWKNGNKYSLAKINKKRKIGPKNCKLILKTPNLTGRKFKYLTVIKKSNKKGNVTYWDCVCKCGKLTKAGTRALLKGYKKSCGCYKIEISIQKCIDRSIHKLRNHPLYGIWSGIKNRCYNKQDIKAYKYYGCKGINVCAEWKNNPEKFINWALSNKWKKGSQ